MKSMYNPAHPGSVLKEWLHQISITAAAGQLGIARKRLSRIIHGNARISADMAIRLSEYLGTSPELWLEMQMNYDLWQAAQQERPQIEKLAHA